MNMENKEKPIRLQIMDEIADLLENSGYKPVDAVFPVVQHGKCFTIDEIGIRNRKTPIETSSVEDSKMYVSEIKLTISYPESYLVKDK